MRKLLSVNIDPRSAKRKVTGWVVSEVGNLLFTAQPKLVIGKRTVWRVPIVLTSKKKGLAGEIGSVDVDAGTGELLVSDKLADDLLNNAKTLVSSAQTPD
jgi:hypothetical protein